MLIPDALRQLIDDGLVEQVLRPLKSGKEAAVFVVIAGGERCAAKVYKAAQQRNFRQRMDYVEGRNTGDSREQRAMDRGSKFGKERREAAWQGAEAAAMTKLAAAGVRIPRPRMNSGGVLLMDLVVGADDEPAPQLATTRFTHDEAVRCHALLVHEIARMLCAGVIHGDLSEFNILRAADGPVIIDLPQAIDAAKNNNAKRLLLRDVANITRFFARFAPELRRTDYGQEMWLLYERVALTPETRLTGRFTDARKAADTAVVLREIAAAKEEAEKRAEIKAWREEEKRKKASGRKS